VSQEEYLLADQPSELERLQLQSRVWEPAGRQLLSKIGSGWVGPSGQVVGGDVDESLLDAARSFLEAGPAAHWFWRSGTWARGTSIPAPPRPSG
jgi:hypothetical protein